MILQCGTLTDNEGPWNWQNLSAITRFRYIEVLFHKSYYYWGGENRSLYRGRQNKEFRLVELPLWRISRYTPRPMSESD